MAVSVIIPAVSKVHFIVNPVSAGGRTARRWQLIRALVRNYFNEYKYILTEKPLQAREITRDLIKRGYDLIVGVGGDGTLNEILNGFFCPERQTIINERASLGFLPSGTGSDFNRLFKVPRDIKLSLSGLQSSPHRLIDIGRITYRDAREKIRFRYFINVADFGMGADVVHHLNQVAPGKRNSLAYYRALLSVLKKFSSKYIKIKIDESQIMEGKFVIGAIANGKCFGGGMQIAPQANIDDGFFDLVLIREMSRPRIICNSYRLYTGSIQKHPTVSCHRVRRISFLKNDNRYLECDGELIHGSPLQIDLIKRALSLKI